LSTASKRAKHVSELPASSSSVSCDNCDKWRRVAQEPTAAKWYRNGNLDAKHSACSIPQEMSDAAIDVELNQMQAAA
jgi:SH3-like domain-containing protein